jgi:upstream activation factor subunit UAF30
MPRKANPALMKPLTLSPALQAVIGPGPESRGQVMKKIWAYIKENNLQNPENKRNIIADDLLLPLFDGEKEVSMFQMTKLLSAHLTDPDKA